MIHMIWYYSNLVNIKKICCVCIRRNRKFRVPSMTRWFRFRISKPTRNLSENQSVYIQRKILPWACLKIKECTESWPWILGDLSGHGWNGGREWHFERCWSHGSAGQCKLLGGRVCCTRSCCHEHCSTHITNTGSICTGVYFVYFL